MCFGADAPHNSDVPLCYTKLQDAHARSRVGNVCEIRSTLSRPIGIASARPQGFPVCG